jgi:hypothetical protein
MLNTGLTIHSTNLLVRLVVCSLCAGTFVTINAPQITVRRGYGTAVIPVPIRNGDGTGENCELETLKKGERQHKT